MSIGTDVARVDGLDKLSGAARYVDDLVVPGVWHGATVRSPVARGRIRRIHFDRALDWKGFAVVDHRDVPGKNEIKLIDTDQPVLAATEVRHKHEPILLLAHPSTRQLWRALRAIRVEIDPLPAVFDPAQPLTPDLIQFGSDNVFKRIDIRKGDSSSVFGRAAHVVEGEYVTGPQEHVYLETQGMLAYREGPLAVVMGSMQCPYYVLDGLTHAFGRPRDAFRVVQTPVGGGFGGKEDFPTNLAIHALLLTEKAGAPVKMVYDRQEDLAVTTKRHPSRVRHRTAVDGDGRLLAMEIDVLLDGGAYVTLSPVVLSRGTIHAAGPYHCDNVHVHGEVRLTNAPPYGAFRGFGAPQTLFAMEVHLDAIARRLGIDPAELRRRNLLRPGQTLATGQVFPNGPDLTKLLDRALQSANYDERRAEHARLNRAHAYLRRGQGLACFHHGSGFTGSGETYLASQVWIEALPTGDVEVLTAQTDMGQGTSTILAQIAADCLGVPPDAVHVATPDTSRVPNSGPTVASRTAMVVGKLVEDASRDLMHQLAESGVLPSAARDASDETLAGERLQEAIREWYRRHPQQKLVGRGQYQKPASVQWDDKNYRGDAYACYSWAAYVAEVEVDLRTFAVRVTDFVARQEVGRVVNPTLARGQVQGGVVQGIGWALYEDVVLDDGAMTNCQMTNYIIPTSGDLPPIRVEFEEWPSPHGPAGAKGLGEMPIDGPAPAIVNAVREALGLDLREIPLTPERLMSFVEPARGNL